MRGILSCSAKVAASSSLRSTVLGAKASPSSYSAASGARSCAFSIAALMSSTVVIALKWGLKTARERGYLGYRLRECLDTLAVTFDYARSMDRKDEQQAIEW